jgi:hypothetical protein
MGRDCPAILDQHHVTVGSPPQEVVADTGSATVTAFSAGADRGVTASIPSWPTANHRGGWDREHFIDDAEQDRYVCPQGQPPRRIHDKGASRQQVCRAPFGVCPSCPGRQACGPGRRARTGTRSFDHELLEAARAHLRKAAGRAALGKRQQFIELVFADAKVRHCPGPGQPVDPGPAHRGHGETSEVGAVPATGGGGGGGHGGPTPPSWCRMGRPARRRMGHPCQIAIHCTQLQFVRVPPPERLRATLRQPPPPRDLTSHSPPSRPFVPGLSPLAAGPEMSAPLETLHGLLTRGRLQTLGPRLGQALADFATGPRGRAQVCRPSR